MTGQCCKYPNKFANFNLGNTAEYDHAFAIILAKCFTQYGLQAAINKFGDPALQAGMKEMQQLHDRDVFRPLNWDQLDYDERKKAINSLLHIKEKRSGKLKGRTCADGRPQRETITKEESTSPTASLESIMLTCIIDAIEKRDIGTVDIPNAFA